MLAALLAILVTAVGALRAAGNRSRPRAGLGGMAFAVQLYHYPGTEDRVVLGGADPLGQLPTRPRPDRQPTVVERHKRRVKARRGRQARALAGRVDRPLLDRLGVAGCMPSPWRVKALRSDGQVVPSSVAVALMLPSRSASAKARLVSAPSARKRLGCQTSLAGTCEVPLGCRSMTFAWSPLAYPIDDDLCPWPGRGHAAGQLTNVGSVDAGRSLTR
jgi:hypothetical protein